MHPKFSSVTENSGSNLENPPPWWSFTSGARGFYYRYAIQMICRHFTNTPSRYPHAFAVVSIVVAGIPCGVPFGSLCGILSTPMSGSVRIFTSFASFFPNENSRESLSQTSFWFFRYILISPFTKRRLMSIANPVPRLPWNSPSLKP